MNFDISDYYHNNTNYGLKIENEKVIIFFGNKNFDKHYQEVFPQFQFSFLKQVHGNALVETTRAFQKDIEADAQWSSEGQIAHVIQTADCIPMIITDKKMQKVAALHAGWRGVENRIIPKVLNSIFPNESVSVFVGPHILLSSFEVDKDVKEQLANCTNPKNEEFEYDKNSDKYYVDLKTISKLQIEETNKMNFYYHANIDTKTALDFCSFRRDRKDCGRNLSFIVRKNT